MRREPQKSFMWKDRAMMYSLARMKSTTVVVHMCAFGTAYRKATRLEFVGKDLELWIFSDSRRVLRSGRHRRCSFSGRQHAWP